MAISQPYSGSLTVSTTELSLISGTSTLQASTTAGLYQVVLDLAALAAGDQFTLSIKEAAAPSGTQRVIQTFTYSGAQVPQGDLVPACILMNGWDMTLIMVAGTARAIPYSIRMVG